MNSLKACVKTKSVQEVLDAQLQVFSKPILLSFGPVVDGYFLPGMTCFSFKLQKVIIFTDLQTRCLMLFIRR